MMSGDGVSLAAGICMRPLHHIHPRAVVLKEVEIDGSEIRKHVLQVAHQ
jgi:hypothetical protein